MSKPVCSPTSMKAFCLDQNAFDYYLAHYDSESFNGKPDHVGSPLRFPCYVNSDWVDGRTHAITHWFLYMDDPTFHNLLKYNGSDPILTAIREYQTGLKGK